MAELPNFLGPLTTERKEEALDDLENDTRPQDLDEKVVVPSLKGEAGRTPSLGHRTQCPYHRNAPIAR
jgi:hypothetical protein